MLDLQQQIDKLSQDIERIEQEYLQSLTNANETVLMATSVIKDLHERLERLEESICG